MKTKPSSRRSELLREFFVCALVIAALKSGESVASQPSETGSPAAV